MAVALSSEATVFVLPCKGRCTESASGSKLDLAPLARGFDKKRRTILLKHRPTVDVDTLPFALQLSGHAHRGQIFFFFW